MHLPIGVSNFRDLVEVKDPDQEGYLFIDKTLLIKEVIYDLTPVIVLTRPRRFGKTLNLSMLHHFFADNVAGYATKELFNNLAISKEIKCMEYQGKYPVVAITFKDVKEPDFQLCLDNFRSIMALVYRQHRAALQSENLPEDDIKYIKAILEKTATRIDLQSSIKRLLELLTKYYKIKPILLIDEYDTPLQEAYLRGYYEELMTFFRNFLSQPLKDDSMLNRAILTGILRISKESLFSGLSNVEIYSILRSKYSNYFGFTETDTKELLKKAKFSSSLEQIQKWYNGYNFSDITVYNPWSIIKFIYEQGSLKSYWINTSGNKLVKNLIINCSNIKENLEQLIAGKVIKEYVDEHIVFSDLHDNPSAIWSLLLMSGYLKYISSEDKGRRYLCELALPNKEVEDFYISVIEEWLSDGRGFNWYNLFLADLAEGRVDAFAEKLQILVEETLSCHDVSRKSQESFYHGLMLAFVSGLKTTHVVNSNKESGVGRYDIALIPIESKNIGIIMEFKAIANPEKLEETAIEALSQIKQSKYFTELKTYGVNKICSIGISFSGKAIKVVSDYC